MHILFLNSHQHLVFVQSFSTLIYFDSLHSMGINHSSYQILISLLLLYFFSRGSPCISYVSITPACFLTIHFYLYLCDFKCSSFSLFIYLYILPKTPNPSFLLHFWPPLHVRPNSVTSLIPCPEADRRLVGWLTFQGALHGILAPVLYYRGDWRP